MYKGQDKEIIELIIFALDRLYNKKEITKIEYLVTYSYILTPLVSQTIAERLVISDGDSIRYMSKQNVHQNLLRKVIDAILDYIKIDMPDTYVVYFPQRSQAEGLFSILNKRED